MHSSVTTTVQEVVGLYEGQRIARTSNAVVNVIISRRYVYEGCEIYVDNIEAQQDQETGRMYVPGPLALVINHLVEGVLASLRVMESGADAQGMDTIRGGVPRVVRLTAPQRHGA